MMAISPIRLYQSSSPSKVRESCGAVRGNQVKFSIVNAPPKTIPSIKNRLVLFLLLRAYVLLQSMYFFKASVYK
ncbi:hypothetical protein N1I86_09070 [Bacillus sp. FSL W8-0116]|uniref:hypothetical protein n=1 Tax=Bacillus sp. FSL W8-0116 TaxID=2978206 RepID=UPI0030F509FD